LEVSASQVAQRNGCDRGSRQDETAPKTASATEAVQAGSRHPRAPSPATVATSGIAKASSAIMNQWELWWGSAAGGQLFRWMSPWSIP
jgi:hypothetical protein